VSWWRSVKSAKETIDRLLRDAREKTQGPRWLPKFLRGLFRKQGRYNRTLLEATTLLGKKNEELRKQVRELTDAVQAQSRWLEHLAAFSREDSSRVNAQFATLAAALRDSHTVFSSYTSSLVETRRADEQWMDAVSDAVDSPPRWTTGSQMCTPICRFCARVEPDRVAGAGTNQSCGRAALPSSHGGDAQNG
jgi:hypothetical protein